MPVASFHASRQSLALFYATIKVSNPSTYLLVRAVADQLIALIGGKCSGQIAEIQFIDNAKMQPRGRILWLLFDTLT